MQRFGLVALGLLVGCIQLALHGMGVYAVVPSLALVVLVIVATANPFSETLWFVLPLGLTLEVSSGAPFGTQLLALLIFVMATKLLMRASVDQPQTAYVFAVLIASTVAINVVLILNLPYETIAQNWGQLALRIGLEALYNSVLLGVWLALTQRSQQKQPGYRLPTS